MRSSHRWLLKLLLPLSCVSLLGCQITVQSLGFGSGVVTINPGGIICTISTGVPDAQCTQGFADDAVLTLTATASAGSEFTSWSGDCDTIAANVCTTTANRIELLLVGLEPDSLSATPNNLVPTPVSISQINLTWTDNANNEAGYFVERCQGAGCVTFAQVAQLGANATAYSDSGLPAGTTFRYRVRSGNKLGFSIYATSGDVATLTPP